MEEASKYGYNPTEMFNSLREVYEEENVNRYNSSSFDNSKFTKAESLKDDKRVDENSRQLNRETGKGEIVRANSNEIVENSKKSSFYLPKNEKKKEFLIKFLPMKMVR